jgi:nucleotide-binding universal stress UspA family protein
MDLEQPKVGHVLCPLGHQMPSDRALAHAIALANRLRVPLTLMHVYEEPSFASSTEPPLETTTSRNDREAARRELVQCAERITPRVDGELHTEFLAVHDTRVADVILDSAAGLDHPVIVMATHARKGMKRLLLGSVTEAVLRRSKAPVLAVPPEDA